MQKTDNIGIIAGWVEHFNTLWNRKSSIPEEANATHPQLQENNFLGAPPSQDEAITALKQTTSGKAPGADGI